MANFIMATENNDSMSNAGSVTPRSKFTNQESPLRTKTVSAIVYEDEGESDNENFLGSPSRPAAPRFSRSPFHKNLTDEFSRSVNSNISSTTLNERKPLFPEVTYQAVNPNPLAMNPPPLPAQQQQQTPQKAANIQVSQSPFRSSVRSTSDETFRSSQTSGSKFNDDMQSNFSSDSTVASEADLSDDEGSDRFKISLDGQIYKQIPKFAQPRRNNPKKNRVVISKNGNLIIDTPVPRRLMSFLPNQEASEFKDMTYSAITCDPDNFTDDGFTLRQHEYGRDIEIVVCITMYNEDEEALTRTLHAVMKNIAFLEKRQNSRTWGEGSWKKVLILIVSDGRSKVSPGVLEVLASMGVYQDGIAKSFINRKEVTGHLFEYTTQLSMDENLKFCGTEKGIVPAQVAFLLKEKNCKKINSHRWLFNGICPLLEPKVTVLLDVGTKPHNSAIYHLWKSFDLDSNVAGAAGEIVAMKGKYWRNLVNPLVAFQNFEYKMSNILDKPCESSFGYISVLPGALSAYRYNALKNHDDGTGPLASYFKGEVSDSAANQDIFSANMYLAEDRILAWELVAKRDAKWVLKFVKDAKGETDVPEALPEFVSQRRRWLNGAFFAALYSQINFFHVWKTDHSTLRKFFLHIEFIYQFFTLLFSIFALANFYIAFYYMAGSLTNINKTAGKVLFEIFNYICVCTLLGMLVISMGNRPQGAPNLFTAAVILLTLCGAYAFICSLYFLAVQLREHEMGAAGGLTFTSIVVSMASTYGLYVFTSCLYLDPWHLISSSAQYFLMLPAYTCLLQIYAFCNTHDVTWGTKGDNLPTANLGSAKITNVDGETYFEIEVVGEQRDIDSMYDETLIQIQERRKTPITMRDGKDKVVHKVSGEDYYRDIRSRVVLFWIISNVILILTITQIYPSHSIKSNKYLAFILWSVFGFAVFRGLGSVAYIIHLGLRRIIVTFNKWQLRKTGSTTNSQAKEKMRGMTIAPDY
ncbi:hypothetical protein B5S28_g3725 [[Candida] boidinii]|nr:hypothetical protein B5S28_g3725 [[Candida] boidinii]